MLLWLLLLQGAPGVTTPTIDADPVWHHRTTVQSKPQRKRKRGLRPLEPLAPRESFEDLIDPPLLRRPSPAEMRAQAAAQGKSIALVESEWDTFFVAVVYAATEFLDDD
jgi:hypothetical protein